MSHSLPNMMATPPVLRYPLGLQHPLGLSALGHSQSQGHMSSDLMSQAQQAQRHHLLQHDTPMSTELRSRSPSPFELSSREGMTHFGKQVTALPLFGVGGDDMGHDMSMGLMDSDMLDMLLKPE